MASHYHMKKMHLICIVHIKQMYATAKIYYFTSFMHIMYYAYATVWNTFNTCCIVFM